MLAKRRVAAIPLFLAMNDINEQHELAAAPRRQISTGPAVLQILPRLEQRGQRGTVDLARHLVERGWRALVASSGGSGEAELAKYGARSLRLPLDSRNPLTIRANIRRLQRVIRDRDIRLVHAHSRAPAWSAWYAARRCEVPFVTTIHGLYGERHGILKRYYNAIMARGDRVIAVSDYVAEHVRRRYGVPDERLRVVHRGIDTRKFDPDSVDGRRVEALAEQWRVRPGTKVVLLATRAGGGKGHRVLLQAVGKLPRRNFLCLMVAGTNRRAHGSGEIEGLIAAQDMGDVVRTVGSCEDMPAALMLADVVVVPSSAAFDPPSRVAVEAQALGRPVVVMDVGGLGETMMPAATGWLVEPDDAEALAHALELALAMPDEARARLAVRARRFVIRKFSLERMGDATMQVYRELLEGLPPDADVLLPLVAAPGDSPVA
jgi:glycosyltransferase involved in cell wall biosynthesis